MDEKLVPAKTLFTVYLWLIASIVYCSFATSECVQGLMAIWSIGATIVYLQYRRLRHRRRFHSSDKPES